LNLSVSTVEEVEIEPDSANKNIYAKIKSKSKSKRKKTIIRIESIDDAESKEHNLTLIGSGS
jgi:hypothetical protein